MDSPLVTSAGVATTPEPGFSPFQRAVAVFTRPASAWGGLKQRAQWWFPLLVMMVFVAAATALLHHRAIVPMIAEGWDQQVANGQIQPQQAQRMEEFFNSPLGMGLSVAQQVILLPISTLVVALLIWFGVGFVLGTGLKYRLALEVASWALLVTIPAQVVTCGLGWMKQTMRGVHVGFGVLLPDMDPPSKLHVALGVFLDAIGPLSIWYLAVVILGAAALSGAPRRSVTWTLGILYLVVVAFMAGLAALFTPAA